jgi:hypothetical protein
MYKIDFISAPHSADEQRTEAGALRVELVQSRSSDTALAVLGVFLKHRIALRKARLQTQQFPAHDFSRQMSVAGAFTAVTPSSQCELALVEESFVLGAKHSGNGDIVVFGGSAIHGALLSRLFLQLIKPTWSTQSSKRNNCFEEAHLHISTASDREVPVRKK